MRFRKIEGTKPVMAEMKKMKGGKCMQKCEALHCNNFMAGLKGTEPRDTKCKDDGGVSWPLLEIINKMGAWP